MLTQSELSPSAKTPQPSAKGPHPSAEPTPTLLLADDDADLREYVALILRSHGYEVVEARDGVELLDQLDFASYGEGWTVPFDVVVADFHMPGLTGLEALEGLAQAGHASRVVVISAYTDDETVEQATSMGAAAFVPKPFQPEALVAAVFKAWASGARAA